MEEIYDEYINEKESDLLETFDKLIDKEQKNISILENLECKLMLKKPDNTLIPLGTSNHEFDLTEKRIEEDSFKTIDIDKKGHFDLKRKYELIATWYDGYKVEVAKASRTFCTRKR